MGSTRHALTLLLAYTYAALHVALFICDGGDSRSLILYFALFLSLSDTLSLSKTCSLSSSISLKLVLSLTLSLFVCRFLTISLCYYRLPWLAEMGSTRHASTLLLAYTYAALPVALFICDGGDSRSLILYFALFLVGRDGEHQTRFDAIASNPAVSS